MFGTLYSTTIHSTRLVVVRASRVAACPLSLCHNRIIDIVHPRICAVTHALRRGTRGSCASEQEYQGRRSSLFLAVSRRSSVKLCTTPSREPEGKSVQLPWSRPFHAACSSCGPNLPPQLPRCSRRCGRNERLSAGYSTIRPVEGARTISSRTAQSQWQLRRRMQLVVLGAPAAGRTSGQAARPVMMRVRCSAWRSRWRRCSGGRRSVVWSGGGPPRRLPLNGDRGRHRQHGLEPPPDELDALPVRVTIRDVGDP